MQSCQVCGTRVTPLQKFCSQCGSPLIKPVEAATTIELTRRVPASSENIDEGRFPPGVILAQRYRIVSLLGRGGMGEVYRANDLLLGQSVALKFLLPAATASESALSRFRSEVRTARKVSHPNVCRVYDIGEVDGLTYLTMEYVDGEDLASLLRRIGKIPQEKALEIARKLCAGLAAAHDQGIVHRDLKPGNIMLDGKGQVRITDFGLASLAEQVSDIRSGTPAYMAPEQHAGTEVTAKSDIYALGVVLHELFTGKQPSRESKNTELDPAVEYVILRCLEENPRMRPASVLSVAAALPGGDPLKAALAAGETPSPGVVANAGSVEGLRAPVAVACLVAMIISIAAFYFLQQRRTIVSQIPMENSPEVLAAQARHIAKSLGYTERPVDRAFGWEYDMDCLQHLAAEKDDSVRETRVKANRPSPLYFWYRESPRYLYHPAGDMVTRSQPNAFDPGMLELLLDSEGRLIEFNAQPTAENSRQADIRAPDWDRLFAAAALDSARFTPTQPLLTPRTASDIRAAWVGSSDQVPHDQLRVEAAAYQGRPVLFRSVGSWTRPVQTGSPLLADLTFPALLLFAVLLPIGAGLLAWRNIRIGRGDRRGSFRLALFASILVFLRDIAGQHHVPTIAEVGLLFFALRDALTLGAVFWVLYMAFEPYVRRRSPTTLISWSRLLAGRFRDPLVGADLLVGSVLGAVGLCVVRSLVSPFIASLAPQLMPTMGAWVALWSWYAVVAVGGALSCVFFLSLMLLLIRLKWLAALASVGLMSLGFALPGATISAVVLCGFIFCCLIRFGLLSTAALLYVNNIGAVFPPPTNLSAWYSGVTLIAAASILVLAVYAFHTTLAGRPLWRHKLPGS
jgi:serine/threonine protein kinase